MNTADFQYPLAMERIAQRPIEPRDSARLLVMHRGSKGLEHRVFRDLVEYLDPGDVLVANDSRVLPARLFGRRSDTAGRVELLLLRRLRDDVWEALVKPGRRVREGTMLAFEPVVGAAQCAGGSLSAEVLSRTDTGGRLLRFVAEGNVDAAVEARGRVPLPPYIRATLEDQERYQTVYAAEKGSAAAPTAGLHFTPELIAALRAKGVRLVFVTLHVGLDTFRPLRVDSLAEHKMHAEFAQLGEEAVAAVLDARRQGRRVVAVGTTAVRVLESAAADDGSVSPYQACTSLFIYPGYRFKVVDALITNFHLPRSTLLMLVSAFAGREFVLASYAEAARLGYRFYSFGDATLVL